MGNVIFDPDLYRRTQEESRNVLQNMIAPPGPAPMPATEKKEKPGSPVTINIGEPKFNPQVEGPNIWQRLGGTIPSAGGGMPNEWYPPWMAEAQPFGPIPSTAIGPFPAERPGTAGGGFIAPPWTGPRPWREKPIAPGGGGAPAEPMGRPVIDLVQGPEGSYQIEGGPIRTMGPDYWKTPISGRGSFSVMPGSGAGMMRANIGGRELTLPASDMRDIYETQFNLADKGYYAAHPEERVMDMLTEQQKPYMDMMNKIFEQNRTWAQGFGLPLGKQGKLMQMQAGKNLEDMTRGIAPMAGIIPTAGERMMENLPGSPKSQYQRAQAEATWAGIPIRQQEADTHRFAAENLGKHYETMSKQFLHGTPGTQFIDREGKVVHTVPPAMGQAAPQLMHWALMSATEETPMGKQTNPLAFVQTMNIFGPRIVGEGYKPITMKEVPKEWISPYIESRITKANPKLKKDSREYQKHYKTLEKLLYMSTGG